MFGQRQRMERPRPSAFVLNASDPVQSASKCETPLSRWRTTQKGCRMEKPQHGRLPKKLPLRHPLLKLKHLLHQKNSRENRIPDGINHDFSFKNNAEGFVRTESGIKTPSKRTDPPKRAMFHTLVKKAGNSRMMAVFTFVQFVLYPIFSHEPFLFFARCLRLGFALNICSVRVSDQLEPSAYDVQALCHLADIAERHQYSAGCAARSFPPSCFDVRSQDRRRELLGRIQSG